MKYKKKPVIIEAFRFGYDKYPEWFHKYVEDKIIEYENISSYFGTTVDMRIKTLEGDMTAHCGDYIIKGVHDEVYPCKPDIFEETYELAE